MRALPIAAIMALALGCSFNNAGVDPGVGEINFPTGLGLSPSVMGAPPEFLYVLNSNFDLRYNAGSVQAFRLADIDGQPGIIDPVDALASEVLIGAHGSGLAIAPDGARLYVSVRSNRNLTFIEAASGTLSCGGTGTQPRCTADFTRGDEAIASARGLVVPNDPVGLAVASLTAFGRPASEGNFVVMAHRAGQVTFFVDRAEVRGPAPTLVHVLRGLPERLIQVRLDDTGTAWLPTILAASNLPVNRIARVRPSIDAETIDLLGSSLASLGSVAVRGVDDGRDIRDVAFEVAADGTRRVYLLTRDPEAVLMGEWSTDLAGEFSSLRPISVGFGPSRLASATLDVGGAPRFFVFASCYNSRDVYVITGGEVVAVIRGMSGPFEMAIDAVRANLYVADFKASAVHLVGLAPLLDCLSGAASLGCEPQIDATLGTPRPVGELL